VEGLRAEQFQWGLVPFFAKDKIISPPLINARAETVFRKAILSSCIEITSVFGADEWFFEWVCKEELKQPYYIFKSSNELLAVAGLWEQWQSKEGEVVYFCCVLTTQANELNDALKIG
jgi:putative SOS response-associated peptidase YedK